ncbi:hypothetical protein AAY81_09275 [Denitrobacterium detoxificans]|uniref:HD/PDEase domain-containing protein n=1 Tax=Denitrobacterium detoxificans TaxID=79604 RepID=A0A172RZU4_9ACTN|nr:HD domain-containing protein [Denitrobacterium detoxificans]ANE23257.1 hypothetical protein AAY81_09275 [Denitrobacterium detoxificans]SEO37995.1 uncharacterized protein SAMN02910314_00052 [Denitrobacterium detoxificans]
MKLSADEIRELDALLEPLYADEQVQSMNDFVQHGAVSTYAHCRNVTDASFWINRHLGFHADEPTLVTAALLHDFYLYDWHGSGWRHSYRHPLCASRNAQARFGISERTASAIESHMWPIGITRPPRTREALVLCIADKYCALLETLLLRKEAKSLCR